MSVPAKLPYGRHLIEEDDVAAVAECLRGDWLTTGPRVEAFEDAFRGLTGAAHAVVCNSGTAALHLSAAALDLGPGTTTIVPSLTFVATANAIRYVGGEVLFADVEPDTGLIGPEQVSAAIRRADGKPLESLFLVHLNGHIADMPGIAAVAERHKLAIVEDACHALGGSFTANGATSQVGDCSYSRIAAFSFHPVKTIAMGEGGMVTTNDPAIAARVRRLRSHGIERSPAAFQSKDMAFEGDAANPWYYELPELGWNYRASDVNCALGLSQLGKLDRFLAQRRFLAEIYGRRLKPLAPLIRPVPQPSGQAGGWHLYPVLIDFKAAGTTRARLMRALSADGIGTQVHYIPVHRQPYYRARYGALDLPGADSYYARCLSLPLFVGMTEDDVTRVVASLSRILGA